jgi:hypothetical protein
MADNDYMSGIADIRNCFVIHGFSKLGHIVPNTLEDLLTLVCIVWPETGFPNPVTFMHHPRLSRG